MKTALSIKGGGIRGVIPGWVLMYIEAMTKKSVPEMFDLVAGTSTGGILGIGLCMPGENGVPRYSAAQMSQLYSEQGEEIFDRPFLKGLGGLTDERYSHEPLERILKEYFGEAIMAEALTRLMVTGCDFIKRRPVVFKSWHPDQGKVRMRDAARATSAAPTYFEPVELEVGNVTLPLVDGGLKLNHPAMAAFVEMTRIWPDEREFRVVSIGTGRPTNEVKFEEAKDWGGLSWLPHIIDITMDGTDVDYYLTWLLKGDYHAFECDLLEGSDDMADAGRENIQALRKDAARLVAENLDELEKVCRMLGD